MSTVNHACLHINGGVALRIDIGTLNVISTSSLTPKATKIIKLFPRKGIIKCMWLSELVTAERLICSFSLWRVFVKTMHKEQWNPEGGRAMVFLLCCSPRIFRVRTDPEVIRPRPNVAYWLVSAVSCTQSQQMKKCLYGMLRYERETVDVSLGRGDNAAWTWRDPRGYSNSAGKERDK